MGELLELIDALPAGQLRLVGHSLGAQLGLMLVCRRPERFSRAVFLSAWVNPREKTVRGYCRLAGLTAGMLHWGWLVRLQARYWGCTPEQAEAMVRSAKQLTPEGYRAFFLNTLDLSALPEYGSLRLPMLALCGAWETGDMRRSLALLGRNPSCKTMVLPRAGHDFPMRRAGVLNPILREFLA